MKRIATTAVAIVTGLCALPLAASTFVAMTADELISESDTVIQGEVIRMRSHWHGSGRIIVTDVTVRVDEVLIGNSPAVVQVRTYGGQVNDLVVEAHGFPKLEMGERVILFLHEDPEDRTTRIQGYQQGHYRVVTRLDGVTLAVPQVDEDAAMLTPGGVRVPAQASMEIGAFRSRLFDAAERLGRADVNRSPSNRP